MRCWHQAKSCPAPTESCTDTTRTALLCSVAFYVDVALNLTSTPTGVHHYAAMTYPGMISSSSLGVSFTGQFYYTINALTPCPVNTKRHAVPVEMLQHQLLTQAQSPEEATALVEAYTLSPGSEGLAYGVNINIGDLRAARGMLPRITTIETSAGKLLSALPLTSASPPEFHFNNVLRMDVRYHYGASSESRMDVASIYRATARAPADVLRFLGDQSNASFPVFRGGTPVDHALTLDTALITVPEDEGAQEGALLRIYTANPRTAQPVLTRPLNTSRYTVCCIRLNSVARPRVCKKSDRLAWRKICRCCVWCRYRQKRTHLQSFLTRFHSQRVGGVSAPNRPAPASAGGARRARAAWRSRSAPQ